MTVFTGTASILPVGVNGGNSFAVELITESMGASDTLNVTIPSALPPDALPVSAICYSAPSSSVCTVLAVALFSHNIATGLTILNSDATIAAGSKVIIVYRVG